MTQNLPRERRDEFMKLWKSAVCGENEINVNDMFTVFLQATRMSGEMNTSLGNGWSNLVLFLFAMHENNASWEEILKCSGFVEGDDALFNVPPEYAPSTEQMYNLGFRLKVKVVESLERASFCGLIFDPEELISVTDPLHVIMKMAWLPRKYNDANEQTRVELLKAKALSALYQYNGCPIITPCCVNVLEQLSDVEFTKKSWDSYDSYHKDIFEQAKKDFSVRETLPKTRELVETQYGISPSMQFQMEEILRHVKIGQDFTLCMPNDYDLFARCYSDYVLHPTLPHPQRSTQYFNFLRKLCTGCGAEEPACLPE